MDKPPKTLPLQGCCVMVTRPVQLADRLSELCAEQGATVIRFPCMEIVDTARSEANLNKIEQLDLYNLLVFISRSAVYYGTRLLHEAGIYRINRPVAAVGIKTAEALAEAGIADAIHPHEAASSEALAAMQSIKNIKRGAVLIFRGRGGNPYLARELTRRGLKVDYVEVYRRQRPSKHLRLDEQHTVPDYITVASGETLANLHAMTAADSVAMLLDRQLVLGGPNIKELCNRLGFKRPPIVAHSPIDEDMLPAIIGHYCKR